MVEQIINKAISEIKEKPKFKKRMKFDVLQANWKRIAEEIGYENFETDIISETCIKFFCSKSEEFYPEINPYKGLFIFGYVGVGKTANFKIYKAIYHRVDLEYNGNKFKPLAWVNNDSFRVVHVLDIESKAYSIGEDIIEVLSNVSNLVIDDLGAETGKFYNTERNVIVDIINRRYNRMRENNLVTHFTSNLSKSDLQSKYGDRVMDRINEMTIRFATPSVIINGTEQPMPSRRK